MRVACCSSASGLPISRGTVLSLTCPESESLRGVKGRQGAPLVQCPR